MAIILDILLDSLRTAVLISGLVVVMMMLIESLNIDTGGKFFAGLQRSKVGQVVVSAVLGVIPGCMGGFATVSLYTHGIVSFGALVAMMIATAGDESFVMLAMFPDRSAWIFAVIFVVAVAAGLLTDAVYKKGAAHRICKADYSIHSEDAHINGDKGSRHLSWRRVVMFAGVALFIFALLAGFLEHEEGVEAEGAAPLVNLLSEEWMYWLFGALSLIVLAVLVLGSDHFVDEHLWHHVVLKHLPSVFCWTFGVLVLLGCALHFFDISTWINSNTVLMILLATAVGIIPESGPHLIFVTLYASGVVPLPVLLASCISQDGHASLPLLAESKKDFLRAKLINCAVALVVGFGSMLLI